jgi:hypothetical protein
LSIAPATAQNSLRDRILISKTFLYRWHSEMGVMKRAVERDPRADLGGCRAAVAIEMRTPAAASVPVKTLIAPRDHVVQLLAHRMFTQCKYCCSAARRVW